MKTTFQESTYVVEYQPRDAQVFAQATGMPGIHGSGSFVFDADTGDLLGTSGTASQHEGDMGWLAFAQDAQDQGYRQLFADGVIVNPSCPVYLEEIEGDFMQPSAYAIYNPQNSTHYSAAQQHLKEGKRLYKEARKLRRLPGGAHLLACHAARRAYALGILAKMEFQHGLGNRSDDEASQRLIRRSAVLLDEQGCGWVKSAEERAAAKRHRNPCFGLHVHGDQVGAVMGQLASNPSSSEHQSAGREYLDRAVETMDAAIVALDAYHVSGEQEALREACAESVHAADLAMKAQLEIEYGYGEEGGSSEKGRRLYWLSDRTRSAGLFLSAEVNCPPEWSGENFKAARQEYEVARDEHKKSRGKKKKKNPARISRTRGVKTMKGPYSASKGYRPWIQRRGKLGQGFLTSMSRREREQSLDHCVSQYGYRSCLGSIMVLERSKRGPRGVGEGVGVKYAKELKQARDYLVRRYGGAGSFGPRRKREERRAA